MEEYGGPERRRYPRLNVNFIVSYRIKEPSASFDLSQTKNLSQGGLLLTTNKAFEKGTLLAMTIRFPFVNEKINLTGQVIGSQEKVRDLIYETHIRFQESDEAFLRDVGKFIEKKLKDA